MNSRLQSLALSCSILALVTAAGAASRGSSRAIGKVVRGQAKISALSPALLDDLDDSDRLGSAVVSVGDVDGNGVPDLAIGAAGDDDGSSNSSGAVYVLLRDTDGTVMAKQKISELSGGFGGTVLGAEALAPLGDLDGDGVPDLAVGARDGLWILFLRSDGTVKSEQEISEGQGGFQGTIGFLQRFGYALACLGDLDGDGVVDLAVGEERDDDGGPERGGIWILFLEPDGTVRAQQKISSTRGGFLGFLEDMAQFGSGLASLGDLDGDGLQELAVGAQQDGPGLLGQGAVWILSLAADGTVQAEQKISATAGGFQGVLADGARFGAAATSPGDLDGDGVRDLVVGASAEGTSATGSVWVLLLHSDGSVKGELEIRESAGGFQGLLAPGVTFGDSVGSPGDLDGDGVQDLLVGQPRVEQGFWTIYLNPGGSVKTEEKVDATASFFRDTLDLNDAFGFSLASIGDLDGDGVQDLAVGAPAQISFEETGGAVWIVLMNQDGTPKAVQEIGEGIGGFPGELDDRDEFGASLASLGDWDGDGVPELAVGAPRDDDGGADRGAVWILFLHADGVVKTAQKISGTMGGFEGVLADEDHFGSALAYLGALNGDGAPHLVVGASGDDGGGPGQGAVWILRMSPAGTVQTERRIGEGAGGFQDELDPNGGFGTSIAAMGDVDGDGVPDLAVGAPDDGEGVQPNIRQGALWVLFLAANGTVKDEQKISETAGGFQGTIVTYDHFAGSLASPGDIDEDGVPDIAVGMSGANSGGTDQGAAWLLLLTAQGTVKDEQKISEIDGGFHGPLDPNDRFGVALAFLGDLDRDGATELVVGANGDDDGGENKGAAWILFLEDLGERPKSKPALVKPIQRP